MKKWDIFLSSLWRALLIGLMVATGFIGLVGIQTMDAPERVIKNLYLFGAILGGIISIIVMPTLRRFHINNGRPIEFDDFTLLDI